MALGKKSLRTPECFEGRNAPVEVQRARRPGRTLKSGDFRRPETDTDTETDTDPDPDADTATPTRTHADTDTKTDTA
ncbi:MAG: hypothetical protein AAF488_17225, partial [Planctomycetota bacterium]